MLIDIRYLKPFCDDNVELFERKGTDGRTYIAVKKGFFLSGLICPMQVIDEKFCKELFHIFEVCQAPLIFRAERHLDEIETDGRGGRGMRPVNSEPCFEDCVMAVEMLTEAINEMPKRFAEAGEKMTRLMKLQAEKGVRVVPKEKLRRDSVWFRMRIRLKLFWFGIRRKPTAIAAALSVNILTTVVGRSSRTPMYNRTPLYIKRAFRLAHGKPGRSARERKSSSRFYYITAASESQ